MSILWTIIIGFVIGLLARMLMPGKDSQGFILTTVFGVAGALVGGYLGQALGLYNSGEPAGLFMSVIGALLVLLVFNHFARTPSVSQT